MATPEVREHRVCNFRKIRATARKSNELVNNGKEIPCRGDSMEVSRPGSEPKAIGDEQAIAEKIGSGV